MNLLLMASMNAAFKKIQHSFTKTHKEKPKAMKKGRKK